jgi:hypothetical protein
LPRFRPELTSYKVLAVDELPDWANASPSLETWKKLWVPAVAQAARIRLGYRHQGRDVEEEFYLLLVGARLSGADYWATEWASSVRAGAGQLEPVRRLHQTMAASVRLDLQWYARVEDVKALYLAIYSGENRKARRISEIVKEANDHVTAVIRDTYQAHRAGTDRAFAQFDRYIRGVEVYRDPSAGRIELPAGYRNAWLSSSGEYIVTENSTYNPNSDRRLCGTWHRLERTR